MRRDAMHKLTTNLARNHATVVVEHLAVANLLRATAPRPDPQRPGHHLRNGRRAKAGLNRAIQDASMVLRVTLGGNAELGYGKAP